MIDPSLLAIIVLLIGVIPVILFWRGHHWSKSTQGRYQSLRKGLFHSSTSSSEEYVRQDAFPFRRQFGYWYAKRQEALKSAKGAALGINSLDELIEVAERSLLKIKNFGDTLVNLESLIKGSRREDLQSAFLKKYNLLHQEIRNFDALVAAIILGDQDGMGHAIAEISEIEGELTLESLRRRLSRVKSAKPTSSVTTDD